jgi:hypothetical protein
MSELGDISSRIEEQFLYKKWTWKTALWCFLCFLILSAFNGLFSYVFDVELFQNKMGYSYWYFVIFFLTLVLYYFYTKLRVNWIGLYAFGLMGLVGIGIEYWLEYKTYATLKSPWGAVGWGVIYITYGVFADIPMLLTKKIKNEILAITLASFILSLALIFLSVIPLKFFYKPTPPDPTIRDYLYDNWFLIPFALVQGVLGAILGLLLGRLKIKKTKK